MLKMQRVEVGDLVVDVDFYHASYMSKKQKGDVISNIEMILGTKMPSEDMADEVKGATIIVHADKQGDVSHYGIFYHLTPNGWNDISKYKDIKAGELPKKSF
ncbi:hypothetical protein KY317_03435 [Candidatus Woesearchaeota archaeon]|nr:hypothetical protein [Candidatus Woesearchaeota archaeon]